MLMNKLPFIILRKIMNLMTGLGKLVHKFIVILRLQLLRDIHFLYFRYVYITRYEILIILNNDNSHLTFMFTELTFDKLGYFCCAIYVSRRKPRKIGTEFINMLKSAKEFLSNVSTIVQHFEFCANIQFIKEVTLFSKSLGFI